MKIFELYILKKIFWPFVIITLGITGIAWLSQSLRFIDLIVNKGLSIGTFLYITILIIPSLMWVIIPISLFISIVYSYNKITSESELIVLKTSGIDNNGLIKPAVIFALICTILSYSIAFYLLPKSYREFKDLQNFIRNNYASILLQNGVFSSPTKGLTIYIKDKDFQGNFLGLFANDERRPDKKITVMAQEGELISTQKGPVFELRNGTHLEYSNQNNQLAVLHFDKYNLQLSPFKEAVNNKRWREPQERFLDELFAPNDSDDIQKSKLETEGHYRISWPIFNVLLALLAISPFLTGNFSRRGHTKKIILTAVIAVLFLIASISLKNIAHKSQILNILMYVNNFVGIYFCYLLINNKVSVDLNKLSKGLRVVRK
ncbi:MAG: LPS export ABC transporter permease LptF [Rickettsiales bacterium]|nr:LPS export ABC transporter permease LptF [Rickettsiales bacterium]